MWVYSFSDDRFDSEKFNSAEEALLAAKEEADDDAEGDEQEQRVTIWVGRVDPVPMKSVIIRPYQVIENAQSAVYDYVGEVADTYLDDVKITPELDAALHDAVLKVFSDHGIDLTPRCFHVVDTVEHTHVTNPGKQNA